MKVKLPTFEMKKTFGLFGWWRLYEDGVCHMKFKYQVEAFNYIYLVEVRIMRRAASDAK